MSNLSGPGLRRMQAYWYAVGHAHGSGQVDRADEFAMFAWKQAKELEDGKTSFLAAIPFQWKQFIEEAGK